MTFEEKIERLELLSQNISDKEISLDRSMEIFEEGITLASQLEKELASYENRVKILVDSHLEDFK